MDRERGLFDHGPVAPLRVAELVYPSVLTGLVATILHYGDIISRAAAHE